MPEPRRVNSVYVIRHLLNDLQNRAGVATPLEVLEELSNLSEMLDIAQEDLNDLRQQINFLRFRHINKLAEGVE